MKTENQVREKSYGFALEAIRLYRRLMTDREYVIARQMVRAATSVGANVEEALAGQSRRDFLAKMSVASKEAREAHYWLRLIRDSNPDHRGDPLTQQLLNETDQLIRILTSIVKTTRERQSSTLRS